ncbi:MAG: respiratory nitrate reductase subunit gamma [Rhodospirillales bacterium]|jgi:nitrate reductase gamma subunit|nr:respiratory nitrate reductase subunit gamma [Rhodospirillales bacterium]
MIEKFFFGAYPYLALAIFLIGSWVRFDHEQYSWKADSTQFLSKSGMRLASNFFHIGVLAIFFGHAAGLLTPHHVFMSLGVSDLSHQWMAILAGAVFGGLAFIGGLILWLRRMSNRRVRAAGRGRDLFILTWILLTLTLGLSTIPTSIHHASEGDAAVMIALAEWVQSMIYFRPDPSLLEGVSSVYKLHIVAALTMFLLFPFTRLVHIWSAPIGYLGRAYQIVRAKRRAV